MAYKMTRNEKIKAAKVFRSLSKRSMVGSSKIEKRFNYGVMVGGLGRVK
jgi:hypothetical protein